MEAPAAQLVSAPQTTALQKALNYPFNARPRAAACRSALRCTEAKLEVNPAENHFIFHLWRKAIKSLGAAGERSGTRVPPSPSVTAEEQGKTGERKFYSVSAPFI